ncbi:MAG: tripartite tricarboxylate transporter substrate binding protein [Burkholderiales bacterium]|nr:tripartite tricarboxylate transporter substrate binding protein [Burkholderiales bacterium]
MPSGHYSALLSLLVWPLALLPAAQAQTYPVKPIRFIVSYAPGGGTDIVARTVGAKLAELLGKQVIIDNRPGAGGNIGTEVTINAPADGYTILAGNIGPIAVNPSLYKLSFVPLRDLAPVSLLALAPLLIVVHPSLPVKNVRELIALARHSPGTLNYSSAGTGSSNHLAGALFNMLAKVDTVHVPYRGAGPAMTDLIAGNVMLSFATMPSAMTQVKAGKLRVLAVTGAKRSSLMPEVHTTAEAGLPGHEVSAWYSIVVKAGTPRAIIDQLHGAAVKALQFPDVRERLIAEGADPIGNTPEEFSAFMRAETEKWANVVKTAGMKVD